MPRECKVSVPVHLSCLEAAKIFSGQNVPVPRDKGSCTVGWDKICASSSARQKLVPAPARSEPRKMSAGYHPGPSSNLVYRLQGLGRIPLLESRACSSRCLNQIRAAAEQVYERS